MSINGAVPVEALLKLSLDKAGAQGIQDFLDKQESSFSRIEGYAGKISGHFEGLSRGLLGLAGIAGVGAALNQFVQTTQAGALTGLAAGQVTGGMGVGRSYGQGLLGAQAQTGVAAPAIAQGLVMAVQAAGGNPTPQQAAILGGLLAGYGNTVGLSPSQVASVVSPILQASNKPLTEAGLLASMAGLTQGLSGLPGSQAAQMLPVLSQLFVSQATGSGPLGGFHADLHGLTAMANAAVQSNSIWKSQFGPAANAVSGGLAGAYGNPAMEAFLQRAGVNYWSQRQGLTPQNMPQVIGEATKLYGTGITRDLALRSMFGLQGANLLEQFAPGTMGARLYQQDLRDHLHPNIGQLQHQVKNAQLSHTPQADISKFSAEALKWLFSSPLHMALGGLGVFGAPKAAGGLLKLLGKGGSKATGALWNALRGSGSSAEGDVLKGLEGDTGDGWFSAAAGDPLTAGVANAGSALSGALGDLAGGVFGATIGSLIFPGSAGGDWSTKGTEQNAVRNVLRMGLTRFGAKGIHTAKARAWMRTQLMASNMTAGAGSRETAQIWGPGAMDASGGRPIPPSVTQGALGILDQALGLGGGSRTASGKDPLDAFSQGATDLEKAAQGLLQWLQKPGGFGASPVSWMGAPGVQGLGAMAPGMEFAALVGGGSSSASFAAFTGGAVGGSTSGVSGSGTPVSLPLGGGGWQPCLLTWYDPALGGTNSASGQKNPNSPTGSGQPYSPTAFTCAAPPNYPYGTIIAFQYNGKSVECNVNDRGGAIQGSHFDLARAPATYLGMINAGSVQAQFKVVQMGNGNAASGNSVAQGSGASAGGGGGGPGTVAAAGDPGGGPGASAASASGSHAPRIPSILAAGRRTRSGTRDPQTAHGRHHSGQSLVAEPLLHLHHPHHLHQQDKVEVHVYVDNQEIRHRQTVRRGGR